MNLRSVNGCSINYKSIEGLGFDAFKANEAQNIFTLCDGANSCKGSGAAALWLSQVMADDDEKNVTEQLLSRHLEMCEKFPDTGSTLLRVSANTTGIELSSVGDSFMWLFKKKWRGWAPWECIETMPRDVDHHGHPTQLVGSEVCNTVHVRNFEPDGLFCAILMSDGPGLLTNELALKNSLSMLGRNEPSPSDLDFLCTSLASDAHTSGCTDDISVAMVWLKFS